ncbi:alpha/beta hydrolase [Aestuariivivens insulae]|uniref:alpha/beta hydrolase n=1 Tax=Aestuariivivens insulae TaxID=1621988 RepID=UPI001F596445|nr:alpha/beta hydrolase [Aestuariivivens insulae]
MKRLIAKLIGCFINCIAIFSPQYAASLAIKLFSSPQKGKHTTEGIDFLNTSFQEAVSYKNYDIITYRWPGKKAPVLLVHGWESNAFRWKALIENLKSNGFEVIALDAPAHGNSGSNSFNVVDYSECLFRIAKKFNAQTVVAHSLGGTATIFFQHKYQLPQLKKLVLLGAPSNIKDVFRRYTNMMGYSPSVVKAIDAFVLQHFGNTPDYYNAAEFSKSIKAKGLIIHDINDNIIPYNDALDYKEQFPNTTLITTNNLDHSLKSEYTDKRILEFISS